MESMSHQSSSGDAPTSGIERTSSKVNAVMSAWGLTGNSENPALQLPRASAKQGPARKFALPRQQSPAGSNASEHDEDMQALLSKIAGLPEALNKATEALLKQSAESEERMTQILQRFENDRNVQIDNHTEKMDTHSTQLDDHKRALDEMRSAWQKFHQDWGKQTKGEHPGLRPNGRIDADDLNQEVSNDRQISREVEDELHHCTDNLKSTIDIMRNRSEDNVSKKVKQSHLHDEVRKTIILSNNHIAHNMFLTMAQLTKRPNTKLARIVDGDTFNAVASLIIISNTVLLGFQTDSDVQRAMKEEQGDQPGWFRPVNLLLVICFSLELIIRMVAKKLYFVFGENWLWNFFDTTMVVTSLLEEIFSNVGGNVSFFRIIKIIKMGRALRILRVLRYSRELRIMVCSIMASFVSLTWAFLLLLIMMYCSSVLLCQGVVEYMKGRSIDEMMENFQGPTIDGKHPIEQYFGSLPDALYSHVLAISGGKDWADIAEPLKDVGGFYLATFIFYIVFVVFGMLNVLTGVFVDRATEQSHLDRDLVVESEKRKKEELCLALKDVFNEADADGSGNITWEEFKEYCTRDEVGDYLQSLELDVSETRELFRMLDPEEHGFVNIEDFIYGCMRVKGVAKSLDLLHIQEDITKVKNLLMLIGDQVDAMGDVLSRREEESSTL